MHDHATLFLVGIRLIVNRSNWRLGDDVPTGAARFGVGALIFTLSSRFAIAILDGRLTAAGGTTSEKSKSDKKAAKPDPEPAPA